MHMQDNYMSGLFCIAGVHSLEQFSLSANPSVGGGRGCPQGRVNFTCEGRELNGRSLYWYLNGDQVSSVDITASATGGVVPSKPGVNVTLLSAQLVQGTVISVRTLLSLVLSELRPTTVACGSRQTVNTTTIACNQQILCETLQTIT